MVERYSTGLFRQEFNVESQVRVIYGKERMQSFTKEQGFEPGLSACQDFIEQQWCAEKLAALVLESNSSSKTFFNLACSVLNFSVSTP